MVLLLFFLLQYTVKGSQNTDVDSLEEVNNIQESKEEVSNIRQSKEVLPGNNSSKKPRKPTTRRPGRLFMTTIDWWSTSKGSKKQHKPKMTKVKS